MCTANTLGTSQNKVTAIDLITTSTGAVTGFPTIEGVNLNVPGLVNDTSSTFMCRLVLQIKFTLAGIAVNETGLARRVARVATFMGADGQQHQNTKTAPGGGMTGDGPSDVTVVRPSSSIIAVSDDPGMGSSGKKIFPVTYHGSFELYAFDIVSKAILAKVTYVIDIKKQAFDDASPTQSLSSVVKSIF